MPGFNRKMNLIVLVLGGLVVSATVLAGDCWVSTYENPQTGFGDTITDPRHAAFLDILHKTDAALKSDPAINAIANVRYQNHLYIDAPYHGGTASTGAASVYLYQPEFWKEKCSLDPVADMIHFIELSVKLNDLTGLGAAAGIDESGTNASVFFDEPKRMAERDGYPIYATSAGNQILVMTRNRIPALVPLTVGEYLDYWYHQLSLERAESRGDAQAISDNTNWSAYIKELRKTDPSAAADMQRSLDEAGRLSQGDDPVGNAEWNQLQHLRKSLTPAQRAQPVFLNAQSMDRYRFGYAKASDEGVNALVKLNPALWSGIQHESEIRTVALQVNIQDVESAHSSGADRWLERVNLRPYRDLLSK